MLKFPLVLADYFLWADEVVQKWATGREIKELEVADTNMEDTAAISKKLVELVAAENPAHDKDLQNNSALRKNGKPRSMTVLKLQWLAERVRKCQAIKEAVDSGTYRIPSEKVAMSILNLNEGEEC